MILLLNPPSKYSKNVVRDVFYGCWCKGKRIGGAEVPNLSLISIATCLESEEKCVLLDASTSFFDIKDVIHFTKNFNIIILSSASMSVEEDVDFLNQVKILNPKLITIVYGAFGTFLPEVILDYEVIDFCVIGEPELIILNLIKAIRSNNNLKDVKGIAYRINGEKIINEREAFIEDLDKLPIPNREYIIDYFYFNPLIRKSNWTTMMTSRGCPEKCIYCASPAFYGGLTRFQSSDRIIKEIKYLIEMGYEEILFRDENFCQSKRRLKEFCSAIIKKGIKFDWICNSRVDSIGPSLIAMMKLAGCHTIKFGVESGNQKMLDKMKKGITLTQTRNVFKWCEKLNIRTHAHVILGSFGATVNSIKDTITFIRKIKPDTATFNLMSPVPGTPLMSMVEKKLGKSIIGTEINFEKIYEIPIYNYLFTNLSNKYLIHAIKKAYRKFYIRPSYIIRQIIKLRSFSDVLRLFKSTYNVLSFIF